MLAVALAGVVMGLVCTAVLPQAFYRGRRSRIPHRSGGGSDPYRGQRRRRCRAGAGDESEGLFVEENGRQTVRRHGRGGRVLRAARCARRHPRHDRDVADSGVAFGIYCSPMLLAVGYLVGVGAVVTWIAGALFANFGLIGGASNAPGLWDIATGQGIVSSLGMGLMMGARLRCGRQVDLLARPRGVGRFLVEQEEGESRRVRWRDHVVASASLRAWLPARLPPARSSCALCWSWAPFPRSSWWRLRGSPRP